MKTLQEISIAIVFGGPSSERDISLDSARTFYDAVRFILSPDKIRMFFIEPDLTFSSIDGSWIYSNTTSDFIISRDRATSQESRRYELAEFAAQLTSVDALFSFVHGTYGEDGKLERDLRSAGCQLPILGSSGEVLETLYDKNLTGVALGNLGYPTTPAVCLDPTATDSLTIARNFAKTRGSVVVKPARGGSSDGVTIATDTTLEEAIRRASGFSNLVLVEEVISGREFSIIVFEGIDGEVMSLLPTEIVIGGTGPQIYTRIKKYMPGSGAIHHNPARFSWANIGRIREQSKDLFIKLGVSDWARFDGFLKDDGSIIWSDLNGVPGYGADSLLFQQASLFGHDQSSISYYLLRKVMAKAGVLLPDLDRAERGSRKIAVIGGGDTSERQVSRMSWLNVIQKLNYTRRNDVLSIYATKNQKYFLVPTFATLQHTVEEIDALVEYPEDYFRAVGRAAEVAEEFERAFLLPAQTPESMEIKSISLEAIAEQCDFVFIALHGGHGENGELQTSLERLQIPYNGSGPAEAAIFMDKSATADLLSTKSIGGVRAPRNMKVSLEALRNEYRTDLAAFSAAVRSGASYQSAAEGINLLGLENELNRRFDEWQSMLFSEEGLVFKPVSDGCSSGVYIWRKGERGAERYFVCMMAGIPEIPWSFLDYKYSTMPNEVTLKLPFGNGFEILVEELHATGDEDTVIELTAAVFGPRGHMSSMIPSQTITEYDLLTLEEKFCKGVGVNVTPPPSLEDDTVDSLRQRIAEIANQLGICGYARIDLMYYVERDELVLIEINTLPGLSMATVTFTQALITPELRLPPSEFLEAIIDVGMAA